MHRVDLNCDLGESFGAYRMGNDEALLELVTSANIACGFHAGDPSTMRRTVRLALEAGTAIGAHPGLPDLVGFGRRPMAITPQEAYDLVVYQIGALDAFVRSEGGTLRHVKPHGALYNMAASNAPLAEAIAEAVRRIDPSLLLFGLSGSELIRAGQKLGLTTVSEAFADRTYQRDGSLTSRAHPGALIRDPQQAADQAVRMVMEGTVRSLEGPEVKLEVHTVCIHGDGEQALAASRLIRDALVSAGIAVCAVSQ
ncbi:LamB/YcsF family protein [Paenibacillus sp. J2TS4]|uniref:LamB/YcsF family protein n=1 Tax=Paenibacillus sp. J2TS4 TaxID=2807194 RepID=UPI001B103BB6|nr:5-oxoprolinase subunit PxpA [Paenibacillus sp. J2TS4]GIP32476.1 UPF0271 protein YcsF [Paenibacillus sp. J2TS4]